MIDLEYMEKFWEAPIKELNWETSDIEKDKDMMEKEGRLTKRILKTLLTHNIQSQATDKHHNNQVHRISLENFENPHFLYLKLWKLKLILENFISILKSFILFSVFYSQPKIGSVK